MSPLNLRRRPRAATGADLNGPLLSLAWQSASLLLAYPDERLGEHVNLVLRESRLLPQSVAEPLRATASRLTAHDLGDLQADYVDTFDTRRRNNLFLTYFAHGDTRKRGLALLRFKQTFAESGVDLDDDGVDGAELPDHLCVVLEYAALVDRERGRQLLLDHRAGLELLRMSLGDADSRWAGAVAAVTATFSPLKGEEKEAVRRLAAEGPPEEEVGLTPYSTPGFDPGPARPDSSAPTPLPMPSFPGGR